MGTKQSTPPRPRTFSESQGHASTSNGQAGSSSNGATGSRTRSMPFGLSGNIHIPGRNEFGVDNDSDSSGAEDSVPTMSPFRRLRLGQQSLPIVFTAFQGIKCPVCNKSIPSDDIECHLVMCFTKPKITYNEDVLSEDAEKECVICLEDLVQGDTIARLPCLCIYHKNCIENWFKVNRSCPEHPID